MRIPRSTVGTYHWLFVWQLVLTVLITTLIFAAIPVAERHDGADSASGDSLAAVPAGARLRGCAIGCCLGSSMMDRVDRREVTRTTGRRLTTHESWLCGGWRIIRSWSSRGTNECSTAHVTNLRTMALERSHQHKQTLSSAPPPPRPRQRLHVHRPTEDEPKPENKRH